MISTKVHSFLIAGSLLLGVTGLPAINALAQSSSDTLRTDKQIYVFGDDSSVSFEGSAPECAGAQVTLAFYKKGPASRDNSVAAGLPNGVVGVGADGSIRGSVSLEGNAVPQLATVWAAASGSCLKVPLFSSGGPVLLAKRDPTQTKDGSSSIVIPASVVKATGTIANGKTLGESIGSLRVLADGRPCTESSLTSAADQDSEGNVLLHVGGASQPVDCSRAGALLTFVRGDGQLLFEQRRLIPGVSQPLANLAPQAPGSGPSIPDAPNTGSGAIVDSHDSGPNRPLLAGAVSLAALALAAGTFLRRRGTR